MPAKSTSSGPRAWLFDFDNTLACLRPEVDWKAARRKLEAYLREAGAPEDLFAAVPTGAIPLYDAFLTRLGRDQQETTARASQIIEEFELAGVERAAPLDGAIELLKALGERSTPAAIVTSNTSPTIERWLSLHDARSLVAVIVGRDRLLAMKPSPVSVERALIELGGEAAEAAFAGDSVDDLNAARAAGVPFHAIAATVAARDQLLAAGATALYASPAAMAIHLKLIAPHDPADATDQRNVRNAKAVR